MKLRTALAGFSRQYAHKVKPSTLYAFKRHSRTILAPFLDKEIDQLTREALQAHVDRLKRLRDRQDAVSALKRVSEWLRDFKGKDAPQLRGLYAGKDFTIHKPHAPLVWSEEEYRALIQAPALAGERWQIMFALEYVAGLRIGELRGIQVEAFDFERCTLDIYQQANNCTGTGATRITMPKSRKGERTIPLPQSLADRIADYVRRTRKRPSSFLFESPRNPRRPIGATTIERTFKKACEEAGLSPRRFHSFRSTTATALQERGLPADIVAALLGHDSADTKAYYTGRTGIRERAIREGLEAIYRHLQA